MPTIFTLPEGGHRIGYLDARPARSEVALRSWRHESALPWSDRAMIWTIAETEIAVLEGLIHQAAPAAQRLKALLQGWDELHIQQLDGGIGR